MVATLPSESRSFTVRSPASTDSTVYTDFAASITTPPRPVSDNFGESMSEYFASVFGSEVDEQEVTANKAAGITIIETNFFVLFFICYFCVLLLAEARIHPGAIR